MRILTVVPAMGAGGAEVVAERVQRDLHARGHQVLLASGPGFRADALAADGLSVRAVPLDSRRPADLVHAVRALRRVGEALRPDVAHTHNVKATVAARAALGRTVPILATMHGVPQEEARTGTQLLRACATHVVAVSGHVADVLVGHGYPEDRLTVVENAVDAPVLPERSAARRTLGIDQERPVAVVLARLAQQKRQDLLVEGWPDVGGDALLLLAGDGPRKDALAEQVSRLDLDGRVSLLGERSDVDVLLAATDLLVLPTDWEGLPISLLEALGAGVPAVVCDVGGVAALSCGVRLVPPGSATALAEAVDELLGDPAARRDLAERGRRLVREAFDPVRMHDSYAALLEHLAGEDPPADRHPLDPHDGPAATPRPSRSTGETP